MLVLRRTTTKRALRPRRGLLFALVALVAFAGARSVQPSVTRAATPTGPRADYSVADIYNCDAGSAAGACDRNAQGIAPDLDLIFPGPGDYQLATSGSYFSLVFEHSAVLLPDLSTLTVLLNGQQLPNAAGSADNSLHLDGANKSETTLRFLLPSTLLRPGFNDLQLDFYQRFREPCDDVNNPALLSTVREATKVHYEYAAGAPLRTGRDPLNLKDFPYPFFRAGWTRAGQTYMVLPPSPTRDELSAAATLALALGVAAGQQPAPIAAITADKLTPDLAAGNDVIAIGTPSRNPLIAQIARGTTYQMTPDGNAFVLKSGGLALDSNAGVAALAVSPFDPNRAALAISGGTDAGLLRAALALSDPRARALLDGDSTAVTQPSDPKTFSETPPVAQHYLRSFADLGFKDQTFNGGVPGVTAIDTTTGIASVAFDGPPAPNNGDITLQLIISHGDNSSLDYNRSQMSVVLNGVKVAGQKLDDSTLNRGVLTVKLRGADVKPGYNQVQIAFSLLPTGGAQQNGQVYCSPDASRGWATLWSDSSIDIPAGGANPQPPDLADYPFPNLYVGSVAGSAVVVGDDADSWQKAFALLADIGRRTQGTSGAVNMMRGVDLTPDLQQHADLLVVGLPSQQPALFKAIDSALPLQFVVDQNGAVTDKVAQNRPDVLIATRDLAQLGIAETIPSPFNAAHAVTVVTGSTSEGVRLAQVALGKPQSSGNVLIAGAGKPATSLALIAKQAKAATTAQKGNARSNALPLLTALFLAASLGLAGYWVYAASRRTQEGD
jgi:hypothetical protein